MNIFDALSNEWTLPVILWLIGAWLLGLLLGWAIWGRRVSALKEELEESENRNRSLQKKNDELKAQNDRQSEELETHRRSLEDAQKRIKRLEAEKGQLHSELYTARDTIDKMKLEADTAPAKAKAPKAVKAVTKSDDPAERSSSAKANLNAMYGSKIPTATAANKDDLQVINGIGPAIEKKLNEIGIYTFAQIAKFDAGVVDTVTDAIQFFPGRIERDDWVKQAKKLV